MLQRVVVTAYDGLDGCALAPCVPRPPSAGELQIDVHAAGVTFADTIMCAGLYQIRPAPPFTLGSESAGVVTATGPGTASFKVGDRVGAVGFAGDRIHGAFSHSITVPVGNVMRLPDAMGFIEAAAFRSSYETCHYAFARATLERGETLLVLGAGGGLGIAAVQLGKLMGARVIASASTGSKRALAMRHGADHAIDSRAMDWRAQVDALADGKGLDVVFDTVGGEFTERAFRALGYRGRHVVVGFATGDIPRLPTNLALMKESSLIGGNLLRCWQDDPQRYFDNARKTIALYGTGALRPHIAGVYPLSEYARALREVAEGAPLGRLVLDLKA